MFVTNQSRLGTFAMRFARMPRWGQVAIVLAVVLPIVVLGLSILLLAAGSGLVVFGAVVLILMAVRFGRRLFRKPVDDGRRNVRIVVSSARVIDP